MPPHSLEEIIAIASGSLRIQLAVYLGPLAFGLILFFGPPLAAGIDTEGMFGSFTEVLRDTLIKRYVVVAVGAWAAFWIRAVQLYLRERQRLYDM